MAIQTYNKDKIDELFALRYVANTSLIKDLDLDDYEDKAIIINQENGKQYQLDKSATATAELGKWKELAYDAVITIDAIPTTDIKTNILYYLKQDYEVLVSGKWVEYLKGFYYAIKNEDGTYTWERASKDCYVQKTHDFVLIDGVKYPSLAYDVNEAVSVYWWFSKGYKVLVTYDENSYYEVTSAEWNSQQGADSEYIIEYICGHYLVRTGRTAGYTTIEEHYDITAPEALVSVSTLPTTSIKTNCFYYLTASTNDYSKGVYHAIKNADNTYTWDKVGKELYIQKTTDYVELDGKQYPKLTQDQLVSYYCYAMFKEGKKVLVTYNETDYYEVINAEWFSGSSSAETRYVVEYICDKWLIKTGRMGNGTFEEHYNLASPDALTSVDALPTTDIKTNVFYRLKADTADKKKGIYYATKNADDTYTWTMVDDNAYVLKATNSVTLDGVVYPTLQGDVNFAYRCYENFKEGKTVLVTYDEKNVYEVINAEYVEDGSGIPNVYVEYICGNWLIKTGSTSSASTFEEHYNLIDSDAIVSIDAFPTTNIKTNLFYRLKADVGDYKAGIYYAVKNADNTYTWKAVGGGGGGEAVIFTMTQVKNISGVYTYYPTVAQFKEILEALKEGKDVWVTSISSNHYTSKVTVYRQNVSPYADYFSYDWENYRTDVYQVQGEDKLTVNTFDLAKTTEVIDNLISTDPYSALSAKQGNQLYKTKLGFVNDLTATTIADLWTWANNEETKDFLKLHTRTFKFSTSSECPKGTSTSDVFVATIYTNTASYGYIRAINYNTGVEYNNYNNNGTWSGWWNSSFEANKHQTMTRMNMWNLGDGVYTNVTWNSSEYPIGVTSTGTTTTVMVTGNTTHAYGTLTCFEQGSGRISICSVQNNVVQPWREVVSNYATQGTGALTCSNATVSYDSMTWYDIGNTRIVHLIATLKGISVSSHAGKIVTGFSLHFSDNKKFFVNNYSTAATSSDSAAGLTISVIGRSSSTANNDFSMNFFNAHSSSFSTSKAMNLGLTLVCTTT